MASLSDQIDRLTRHTKNITAAAKATANPETSSLFTKAVLHTQLGDLIRDIDPSELGLFSLVQNPSTNIYNKEGRSATDPTLARNQFTAATPLKRRPARQDPKQVIDPEVYTEAALKYISQYEPIRPMPRAYDQIVNILHRLNDVRKNIEDLTQTLKQAEFVEEPVPIKTRVEQEERHIKDLQARIAELSKKKESVAKAQKPRFTRTKAQPPNPPKDDPVRPKSPSSPQEEQFWATPGDPGRTLRFADNLMDEEVNLGDVSTASFGSPSTGSAPLGKSKMFAEADSFIEEPTITNFKPPDEKDEEDALAPNSEEIHPDTTSLDAKHDIHSEQSPLTPSDNLSPAPTPVANGSSDASETPGARQRRIRVNREVERIVTKIWSTIGEIIPPPRGSGAPSVSQSLSYLQHLSSKTPQLDSPIASSASSISIDGNTAPTVQQVLTAHLVTMLLSSPPNYSMPLNQVKENLTTKAKTSGISVTGQGTTRVLYGCVAKRLIKIDRGGREQVVRFDV